MGDVAAAHELRRNASQTKTLQLMGKKGNGEKLKRLQCSPDEAGACAAATSFGGELGAVMSFEGEEAVADDAAGAFLGAAAEPPEKNDAIDLCINRPGTRVTNARSVLKE